MKKLRRSDLGICRTEANIILDAAEYGVLSTVDADGQPYGVPLSFVHLNNNVYFHCALSGHKLDNLEQNARVSFCAVSRTRLLPAKFDTEYESVVVFGAAAEVHGVERYAALVGLLEKYCPDYMEEGKEYIAREDRATKVIKIAITHVSGKACRPTEPGHA